MLRRCYFSGVVKKPAANRSVFTKRTCPRGGGRFQFSCGLPSTRFFRSRQSFSALLAQRSIRCCRTRRVLILLAASSAARATSVAMSMSSLLICHPRFIFIVSWCTGWNAHVFIMITVYITSSFIRVRPLHVYSQRVRRHKHIRSTTLNINIKSVLGVEINTTTSLHFGTYWYNQAGNANLATGRNLDCLLRMGVHGLLREPLAARAQFL